MAKAPKELQVVEKVDNELVEKAYNKLHSIFSDHFGKAMMDAGQYILDQFYGGDIELARSKKSPKNETLHQLINQLDKRSSTAPSKSWVYQSVGLVIQSYDLENYDSKTFQTYGKLSLSHKVALLPVKELEQKKELVEKSKGMSVRELNELKKESEDKSDTKRQTTLLGLLNKPEKFEDKDIAKKASLPALKKHSEKQLIGYKEKAEKKYDLLKKNLEKHQNEVKSHQTYMKRFEKLFSDIDKVLEAKQSEGENQPAKE